VIALHPHDAEAEIGGAGINAHHDLHGKSFWICARMPLSGSGPGGSPRPCPGAARHA
jgi:hypothetical protein